MNETNKLGIIEARDEVKKSFIFSLITLSYTDETNDLTFLKKLEFIIKIAFSIGLKDGLAFMEESEIIDGGKTIINPKERISIGIGRLNVQSQYLFAGCQMYLSRMDGSSSKDNEELANSIFERIGIVDSDLIDQDKVLKKFMRFIKNYKY